MMCTDTDIGNVVLSLSLVFVKTERIKNCLDLHNLINVGLVHFQIHCFNVLLNNKNNVCTSSKLLALTCQLSLALLENIKIIRYVNILIRKDHNRVKILKNLIKRKEFNLVLTPAFLNGYFTS